MATKQRFSPEQLLYLIPLFFAVTYLLFVWYATRDTSYHFAAVVQAGLVWELDDSYRYFLASAPFNLSGIWLWDYYLPGNLIFDGLISSLTAHSEMLMRSARVIIVMLALALVSRAGRAMGIGLFGLISSMLMLMLMPLNLLLSGSFYGEALLAAVVGLSVYALVMKKPRWHCALVSIMPFIRPEGAFYVVFSALQSLISRQWAHAFFMVIPSAIYGAIVLIHHDYVLDHFFTARHALGAHYPLTPENASSRGFASLPYYTVNIVWWLTALIGACLPVMRRFWPLFLGMLVLMVYWYWKSHIGDARGEVRYLYSGFPLFMLAQAALIDTTLRNASQRMYRVLCYGVGVVVLLVTVENWGQVDPVRKYVFGDKRWPINGASRSVPDLYKEAEDILQWKKETASFLEKYVEYDEDISRLIIGAWQIFPELNLGRLPENIHVELAPMSPGLTYNFYGGYFYTMFAKDPHYSFYRFANAGATTPNNGGDYALFVGPLYNGVHDPIFANPVLQVYKVYYQSSLETPFFKYK